MTARTLRLLARWRDFGSGGQPPPTLSVPPSPLYYKGVLFFIFYFLFRHTSSHQLSKLGDQGKTRRALNSLKSRRFLNCCRKNRPTAAAPCLQSIAIALNAYWPARHHRFTGFAASSSGGSKASEAEDAAARRCLRPHAGARAVRRQGQGALARRNRNTCSMSPSLCHLLTASSQTARLPLSPPGQVGEAPGASRLAVLRPLERGARRRRLPQSGAL